MRYWLLRSLGVNRIYPCTACEILLNFASQFGRYNVEKIVLGIVPCFPRGEIISFHEIDFYLRGVSNTVSQIKEDILREVEPAYPGTNHRARVQQPLEVESTAERNV